MSTQTPETGHWITSLDQISEELEATLAQLEGLEQTPETPVAFESSALEQQLDSAQRQLGEIYERVSKAGDHVQEAETLLKSEEGKLIEWINEAKSLHAHLTDSMQPDDDSEE